MWGGADVGRGLSEPHSWKAPSPAAVCVACSL